jgi:hypothetical protein
MHSKQAPNGAKVSEAEQLPIIRSMNLVEELAQSNVQPPVVENFASYSEDI